MPDVIGMGSKCMKCDDEKVSGQLEMEMEDGSKVVVYLCSKHLAEYVEL